MSQFAAAAKNPPWARGAVTAAATLGQPPPPGTSALGTSILAAQATHAPTAGAAAGLGAAGAVPTGPLATAAAVVAAQTQQAQQAPAVSAAYGTGLAAITLTQSALQQGAVLQQQGIAIPASLAATTQVGTVNSGMVVELTRLPQPGVALPTTLATTQVATVSYPAPRLLAQTAQFQAPQAHPHQTTVVQQPPQQPPPQQQQQALKQRVFTGTVTKLHDNFGFVDEDVFFQISAVKGSLPKVGERVLVEAAYNPNMPFKWNATRIQVLPNQVCQINVQPANNARSALTAPPAMATAVMAAPVSVGLNVPPGVNVNAAIANIANSQAQFAGIAPTGRWQVPQEISAMEPIGPQRIGIQYDARMDGQHQWIQEVDYGEIMENKAPRMGGMPRRHTSPPPVRRERERERDGRREERRERYRERDYERDRYSPPVRKRSRSPRRPSRSPPRRRPRIVPRYTVQIPKISLDMKEGNLMELRKRYSNLYVPSDFCSARLLWQEAFPPNRPFGMDHQCSFHIMSKDIDAIMENDAVLEPSDTDHVYSAKVMLMATPPLKEIFRKSCALAEDTDDMRENFVHPTRLISFLVGLKGKNETVAIGGPWSPSLDGPNPDKDPSVLVRTAIRTCKALTGIDLSRCSQWYRFAEIYYRRGESTHKGRVVPTRVETVVLFLPDVWSCLPTRVEWDGLTVSYKKQLQKKLREETEDTNETQEEEEGNQEEEKKEPTHYSELDPKTIKVTDLRRELEARNLSTKGLKSQLIARLTKALKTESEKEQMGEQQMDQDVEAEEADKQDTDDAGDDDKKKKEDEEKKQKEEKERVTLERRFQLPEAPAIIAHPSRTAKSGKFDCTIMSLSLLLDYRQEDNKEHSFEVSLFAEIFNEMMMRDFGFRIYRSLVEFPEPKDDEKEKDKKKDKKDEKKDRKEDKDDHRKKDEGEVDSDKDEDDSDDEEDEIDDKKEKDKKKRRKKKTLMFTYDPYLLLSYVYFDQTHCGYLLDKDLEEILYTLGLQLSRAQVRRLLQKVCKRETFHYRKVTDRPLGDNEKSSKTNADSGSKVNLEELAAGNRRYLPVFKCAPKDSQQPKNKTEGKDAALENIEDNSKGLPMVTYQGALVDIGKLMKQLERSEKARIDIERKLKNLEDELDKVHEVASTNEKNSQKLSIDLEDQKCKLHCTEEELRKSQNQAEKYQRTLTSCRDQLQTALSSVESVLRSKSSRSSTQRNSDNINNVFVSNFSSVKKETESELTFTVSSKEMKNYRELSAVNHKEKIDPKLSKDLPSKETLAEACNNVVRKEDGVSQLNSTNMVRKDPVEELTENNITEKIKKIREDDEPMEVEKTNVK